MDKVNQLKTFIRDMIEKIGISYFEVTVSKGHEKVFDYIIKPTECAGQDKLYMYSCTKPLTVACVMQLVEQGKIHLSDPVIQYIPAFKDTYWMDEKGEKQVVGHLITLRHLMTMSAGLSYDFHSPSLDALYKEVDDPTTAQIIDAIAKEPLLFYPGKQFKYSFCLDVMARVVEVVSGMTFSRYAKKYVFDPLHMNGCGFRDDDRERVLPQFTAENGKVLPCEKRNIVVDSVNFDSGGGGLIGTVADYAKFADALANGGVSSDGYRLLTAQSVAAIHTPEIENLSLENQFTCVQGDNYSYGLGVRTRTAPTEFGLGAGEFGWDGAAGAYLMVDPNKNISVVMGMHVLNWPDVFKDKHLQIVEQIYRTFDL